MYNTYQRIQDQAKVDGHWTDRKPKQPIYYKVLDVVDGIVKVNDPYPSVIGCSAAARLSNDEDKLLVPVFA